MTILFWIMSDSAAKRVTNSFNSMLRVLPISKIIKAVIEYLKSRRNDEYYH
jgi:hypothetical protein